MEESLNTFLPGHMTEEEAGSYSPLVLAFLGDSVYELAIRTMLLHHGNASPNDLNKRKNRLVKAAAQSQMMEKIEPLLTEKEESIYKRGRNAKSYTMAKHATMADYRRATGFEALMGFLYLCGRTERYLTLIKTGLDDLHVK
jgi:ribonuclease-3 family protein